MKKPKRFPWIIITSLIVIFYLVRIVIKISRAESFPYTALIVTILLFFAVFVVWLLVMKEIRRRIIRDIERELGIKNHPK